MHIASTALGDSVSIVKITSSSLRQERMYSASGMLALSVGCCYCHSVTRASTKREKASGGAGTTWLAVMTRATIVDVRVPYGQLSNNSSSSTRAVSR